MSSESRAFTILGFVTILIWGTSAIFTRNLSTGLGAYTSAALVNLIGGITVLVIQAVKKQGLAGLRDVPKAYLPVCGTLFVVYTATSYVSMSMVQSDASVVVLVLIRFLWPLFTLIFTIPILKARASGWLVCSVAVSFLGIVIAKLGNDIFHLSSFVDNILSGDDLPGYLLGFVVAISWGLYTNLTKKYIGTRRVDAVGIYMILTAVVLGSIAIVVDEPRNFSPGLFAQVLYAAIVVGALANTLWNLAIKKGNMLLVVLVSNFLPIISTVMTSFMLGVGITIPILVGSILVVVGTLWSKNCFKVF